MPDLPDYTRQMVLRYEGGFIGLEELAARLESIVPWDFQGNIILAEGFESEETEVVTDEDEGASACTRSSRHKYAGDWSMKLFSDDLADSAARFTRYSRCPKTGKVTVYLKASFDVNIKDLLISADSWNGTRYYYPRLKYDGVAQKLYIWDSTGAWLELDGSLRLGQAWDMWYTFRIDYDLDTGYYVKAYVAGEEYDLSGYAMSFGGHAGAPFIATTVENYSQAGVGYTGYIDNLVIAENVP